MQYYARGSLCLGLVKFQAAYPCMASLLLSHYVCFLGAGWRQAGRVAHAVGTHDPERRNHSAVLQVRQMSLQRLQMQHVVGLHCGVQERCLRR